MLSDSTHRLVYLFQYLDRDLDRSYGSHWCHRGDGDVSALFGTMPKKRLGPFSRTVEEELSRQPLRYHVQAAVMGAGAGIAAAFNAPLAGTVFVVEEAASFFSKKLLLHSFICCAFAVMTCNVLSDYVLKLPPETISSRTTACGGIQSWMDSPWMAFHVAVVGALCGLLAIFFNRVVVALGIYFAEEAKRLGRSPKLFLRRFAYSIVIGCCCGAFAIILPKSQPCPDSSVGNAFYGSSGCILEDWLQQVVQGGRYVPKANVPREFQADNAALVMSYEPRDGVFGAQYNPAICSTAIYYQKDCEVPGIEAAINKSKKILNVTFHPKDFCCHFQDLDSLRHGDFFNVSAGREPKKPMNMGEDWPRGPCTGFTWDDKDKKAVDHYSPGAALTLVPPTAVVRNLLVGGAPFVLPMSTVATFLLGYFILAACCSTASGLHVGGGGWEAPPDIRIYIYTYIHIYTMNIYIYLCIYIYIFTYTYISYSLYRFCQKSNSDLSMVPNTPPPFAGSTDRGMDSWWFISSHDVHRCCGGTFVWHVVA